MQVIEISALSLLPPALCQMILCLDVEVSISLNMIQAKPKARMTPSRPATPVESISLLSDGTV
jgi:hypothetical protein